MKVGWQMRKSKRLRRWIIVLVITFLFIIYYNRTLGDILLEIKSLPASLTIISIVFTTIYYIIEGKLIEFVASRHNKNFTWVQGIAIAYIGSFYRFTTMGAAAGPSEVYYLYQEGIPISRGTGMCLVKFIIHKVTIAVYGILGYLVLSRKMNHILKPYRIYIIIGSLIAVLYTVLLIAVCISRRFSKLVIWLVRKIPVKRVGFQKKSNQLIESIILLQDESSILFKNKEKILWIFILNIGKQTCYYLIPAIFFYFRSNILVLNVVPLMAVCNMLAGVLPAPSGIGSLEYVFLLLFQSLTKVDIAASVILLYRFVTWLIPFVIGGVFVAVYKKRYLKESN